MNKYKDEIIKNYKEGENTIRLGKKYSVSNVTIWHWLKKWGIKLRSRGEILKQYRFKKGTNWWKGKHFTKKHKEKLSEIKIKNPVRYWLGKNRPDIAREKNHLWRGGKSFELYGFEWTDLLKHSIRTRDYFICQICKKNGWVVHHIDYNKKNNNPDNLITLCNSCHTRTNSHRDYWIKFFNTAF